MDINFITHQRLANQNITNNQNRTISETVAWLGALQAQDYMGALWSIGLRVPGSTQKMVEQAIVDREIIRTWPMRGTLHFVAAKDIRWMLELLTARVIAGSAYRVRNLELTDAIFEQSRMILAKALQGNKQLSRSAVCALLEDAGIDTRGQRGIHILWRLSQEGLLCFANHEGKQPTFALLSDWAPQAKSLPRDEALATLAKRYFSSHGPATMQDFMWWSGLIAGDAKRGVEQVKNELSTKVIEGKTYWMADTQPIPPILSSVHLLPGFDEYMLGYKDRSAALAIEDSQKIVPGNNGMFLPTIVADGKIVGLWKRTIGTKTVTIAPNPFDNKLTTSQFQQLTTASTRYGQFLGLTAIIKPSGDAKND